jgi:hypothetical protein
MKKSSRYHFHGSVPAAKKTLHICHTFFAENRSEMAEKVHIGRELLTRFATIAIRIPLTISCEWDLPAV